MRIILCEDSSQDLLSLAKHVEQILDQTTDLPYTITPYQSSHQLMFDLEDKAKADLYILDIDMPGINGIDLADQIHKLYPYAMVFFYTSHMEFATVGYRVDAKRFLLKGDDLSFMKEALAFACQQYDALIKNCIQISYYHSTINVPVSDIIYVQKDKRLLAVHTIRETMFDSRGVKELYDAIHNASFIMLDRRSFVNLSYVQRIDADRLVLFNGDKLPFSENRIAEIREAISRNWRS